MALEFSDIVIKIQKILDKYKKNIQVGDYITLKEDLDSLEAILNSVVDVLRETNVENKELESENHILTENLADTRHDQATIKYWKDKAEQINNASFKDKLKFLFNRKGVKL